MSQPDSLVAEIEVKTSADHFYDTLKGKKQHRIHDVAPHHIHKVEVHEGEWDKSGNIKVLTFADGKLNLINTIHSYISSIPYCCYD